MKAALSREEVVKLTQAAKSPQDRLLILMLYYTGTCTGELGNPRLDNVDTKTGVMGVVGLKSKQGEKA